MADLKPLATSLKKIKLKYLGREFERIAGTGTARLR
jgi:hypothetical protein